MAILTTPAIVLRRVEHSETSLICTFYTRDYGRLTAIAKGARRQKSQFAGFLDIMSYLQVTVYTKESREVQTLSSAEYVRTFAKFHQDIRKSAIGLVVIETIRQAIIGEEPHPEIFDLIITTLTFLNDNPRADVETLWWFHLHLGSLLGFHPNLQHCHQCGKSLKAGYFSSGDGHLYCEKCGMGKDGLLLVDNMNLRVAKYLLKQALEDLDLEAIQSNFSVPSGSESRSSGAITPQTLTEFIVKYLRYHVEGIGTLRSLHFFNTFT